MVMFFVVVFLWWCFFVVVFFCGGVFLWWCFLCFCGGVFFVGVFCGGVGVLLLRYISKYRRTLIPCCCGQGLLVSYHLLRVAVNSLFIWWSTNSQLYKRH